MYNESVLSSPRPPVLGDWKSRDIALGPFGVAISLLNGAEIYWLLNSEKKLRVYQLLLLFLAAVDFVMGLFGIAQFGVALSGVWKDTNISSSIMEYIIAANAFASNSAVVLLTFDRMAAVAYPLKHRIHATNKKLALPLLTIIVGTICLTIGVYLMNKKSEGIDGWRYLLSPIIAAHTVAVVSMYAFTLYRYRRSRMRLNGAMSIQGNEEGKMAITRADRMLLLSCMAVVVTFVFLYVPVFIIFCLPFTIVMRHIVAMATAVYVLIFTAALINPCVYFLPMLWNQWKRKPQPSPHASNKDSDSTKQTRYL